MPAVTQRRTEVVALGGVVEHHVEHDLQACAVQGVDHRLELARPARRAVPARTAAE